MSDWPGPVTLVDADPLAPTYEAYSAFPRNAGALLDRLVARLGLSGELEPVRRAVVTLGAVPLEASVSLRPGAPGTLRFTLGIPPRPGDPDARRAMLAGLTGLGAERVSTAVDEALACVAPAAGHRRLVRALAFRVRSGEPPRLRAGAWVGGETTGERFARVAGAMRRLGFDWTAALNERISAHLAANPFNAFVAYGLAFAVGPDRIEGAKTYFACEWADVGTGLLSGRLKDELGLDGVEGFELLAESARADRRRARWLTEVGFELPADPARGARAKAYLLPAGLAANEAEGHTAILGLAARLGLDPSPYEELVSALRPDGLTPERPCSLMVGVSASAGGPSLEIYVLNPGRWDSAATLQG
jgi:hypothetical protein